MSACRHRKTWLIAGGRWNWCWQCGALREMQNSDKGNFCFPVSDWQKPVGPKAQNPYGRVIGKRP